MKGWFVKMKRMKKILCLLLSAILLFAICSCSADDKSENLAAMPNENVPAPGEFAPTYKGNESTMENGGALLPEKPFVSTADQNVSTFSADVDTASYAYFRKLVNAGYSLGDLKNSSSVFRTEEFINYFDYTANAPKEGELFGVDLSIADCPWNTQSKLLCLTLEAESAVNEVGNNLVFLIDVSGSMGTPDKLPLLKKAFATLTRGLTPKDTVSIVTYSGKEEVVLSGAKGNETERILDAVNSLVASGSTNGEAGLSKAYAVAEANYLAGGNNRIIMASDGDLNVGISSAEELKKFVEGKRKAGVYLSVLGFGTGNYRDSNMETLADHGNGVYYYIDGESEAEKVFGSDLLGTLYTVAEDVKLQVTFDPSVIAEYRLIGYENRILNQEDFTNDTKDAGDVGAGHQVTVCYELKLTKDAPNSEEYPWATLAVRYKKPGESISLLNEYKIGASHLVGDGDEDMIFLTSVIETVMLLRQSQYLGDITLDGILETLSGLELSSYPERMEFYQLLQKLK